MSERFVYVWEFQIVPDLESEFLRYYAPDGVWAELFGRHPGYIETLLLKDQEKPDRYLTADRWQSAEAYRAFREIFAQQYEDLDRQCETLTLKETPLGAYREMAQ